MGMRMPAWFDLYGLDASSREDDEGIAQATRLVHGMIDAEVNALLTQLDCFLLRIFSFLIFLFR